LISGRPIGKIDVTAIPAAAIGNPDADERSEGDVTGDCGKEIPPAYQFEA
jgi:hypothetical protein